MFCLDCETLGVESTSVVLSIALLHFDETKDDQTWESLCEDTVFVKLSVRDQVDNYKRTVSKDTLEWWKKQSDLAKDFSFTPKKSDQLAKDAINTLKVYIKEKSKNAKNDIIWVRGSIDQIVVDSLCNAMEVEKLFPFWNYRDIRTFIDFNTETGARGYSEIDMEKYPGKFNIQDVIKHNPICDVAFDTLQILYGK